MAMRTRAAVGPRMIAGPRVVMAGSRMTMAGLARFGTVVVARMFAPVDLISFVRVYTAYVYCDSLQVQHPSILS